MYIDCPRCVLISHMSTFDPAEVITFTTSAHLWQLICYIAWDIHYLHICVPPDILAKVINLMDLKWWLLRQGFAVLFFRNVYLFDHLKTISHIYSTMTILYEQN